MLNLDFAPTFTRTATFQIPSGTGFAEMDCSATFAALTIDEFNGFDMTKPDQVKAFLVRVIQDLDELVDGRGEAVRYTPAIRDQLINHDWGRTGLVRAYVAGRSRAAEGN